MRRFKVCAGCDCLRYCNASCQAAHWPLTAPAAVPACEAGQGGGQAGGAGGRAGCAASERCQGSRGGSKAAAAAGPAGSCGSGARKSGGGGGPRRLSAQAAARRVVDMVCKESYCQQYLPMGMNWPAIESWTSPNGVSDFVSSVHSVQLHTCPEQAKPASKPFRCFENTEGHLSQCLVLSCFAGSLARPREP
jgi:hypothetical protein